MRLTREEGVSVPTHKFISIVAACSLMALLSSCITTTTGGFQEASEEQAMDDYIQLAVGYFNTGDMTQTRRHLNNVLEIDDRNADAYNILALVFQNEGDLDLAEENYRLALRYDSENSRARNNYASLLYSRGNFEAAYSELQRVAADVDYEGRSIAFENLGRSAIELGRLEEAERAFGRALILNSNLYNSSLELAILRLDRGDWALSRQAFQQYLTTVEFNDIPLTPNALLAGIRIENYFQNSEAVEGFVLILSTIYQDSPEYQVYQELSDAN